MYVSIKTGNVKIDNNFDIIMRELVRLQTQVDTLMVGYDRLEKSIEKLGNKI